MGPKIIFYFAGAKFVEVIRYLLPGVTPDKIGIALGKADFSQGVHHGWTRKCFREKDGIGMTLAHKIGRASCREREWVAVGAVAVQRKRVQKNREREDTD